MRAAFVLRNHSDQQLLTGIQEAVSREREDLALVIAHLVEMERRELALPEGCSSLSKYCIEALHLSEWQAYRRVDVARVAIKFPIVLDMLAEGLVNVTAVFRLGPSLTEENHRELLKEAVHQTREQVEEIVARLRPKPPVQSMIRKLPSLSPSTGGEAGLERKSGLFENPPDSAGSVTTPQLEPVRDVGAEPVRSSPSRKGVVSPLAPEIYKIQFTANTKTRRKLQQLQEMLRHRVPNGDVGKILAMGIDLLFDEVSRDKFAKVKHPRKKPGNAPRETTVGSGSNGTGQQAGQPSSGHPASRHIPAEVQRQVWSRDDGQCAFVSKSGRRCSERGRIEYHHLVPFAWGGESTVGNIQLRCRAHNAYEGEAIFGKVVTKNGGKNGHTATGPRTSSMNGEGNHSTEARAVPTGPRTS